MHGLEKLIKSACNGYPFLIKSACKRLLTSGQPEQCSSAAVLPAAAPTRTPPAAAPQRRSAACR